MDSPSLVPSPGGLVVKGSYPGDKPRAGALAIIETPGVNPCI